MELMQWWNLPFVLPFAAGVVYLILMALGGDLLGGVEADADADVDADLGVDHDFDHGIEHSVGHEGEIDHEPSLALKALSFLGLGKVPISLLMMSFCFVWGISGWISNQFLESILRIPEIYFWFSLSIAGLSSIVLTRYLARGLAKIMPATESYVISMKDLVGKRAETRYPVTSNSGSATLYDIYNNLQEVSCRVETGEERIPANTQVILVHYDEQEKVFLVRRDQLETIRKITR